MTEDILHRIGFEKVVVTEDSCYYYRLKLPGIHLITNTNEGVEKDGWLVSIVESTTLRITDEESLKALIDALKLNIKSE